MSMDFDCSVIVCSYNPKWEKLKPTLKSILLQKDCNYKIVVADDGSNSNLFNLIERFFSEHNFKHYELVASSTNRGTVMNLIQGIYHCKGEYVKPISPGDCMHGCYALKKWCEYMDEHKDYVMSYCDSIYYQIENDKFKISKRKSSPQSIKPTVKEYLMYRDFCLGASTLVRKEKWMFYLKMICNKVIYTEDASYQLMIYCGENFINIPKSLLLYEYGFGVTTSGNKKWIEKIRKDEKSVNDIISTITPCVEADRLNVKRYLRYRDDKTWIGKCCKIMLLPSLVLHILKRNFFSRKTAIDIDSNFVNEIFK